MRYRAVISYFGAAYVGWQRQLNGLSVQQVVEEALERVFGAPTPCTASGRTDAGVHAEGQVIHFDADTSIPEDKIPFAVNTELPEDVSMLLCEKTNEDFNARFHAKRKTYCYRLYLSRHRRPLLDPTHEHITVPLDVTLMRDASHLLEGEHDFKCFEATGSAIKNTVRTLYQVKISTGSLPTIPMPTPDPALAQVPMLLNLTDPREFNCTVDIYVTGNGFLYNMVRIIAGTLVYVGMGKLSLDDVKKTLETGDRTLAGKTLPAKGLHLIEVNYEDF